MRAHSEMLRVPWSRSRRQTCGRGTWIRRTRALLAARLAGAMFKPVDAANVSMVQRRTNNTGRDDLAAAPALVRGAIARAPKLRARLRAR